MRFWLTPGFKLKLLKHIRSPTPRGSSAHMPQSSDQTQWRTERERERGKKKEVKAMLRQITFSELAALSGYDSVLNKTWKLEKEALLYIQRLVAGHDILRDRPASSQLSLGDTYPSDTLYIRTIKHGPSSRNIQGSRAEARLTGGLQGADKHLCTDFLWTGKQLHSPLRSIFGGMTEEQSLTGGRVAIIRKINLSPEQIVKTKIKSYLGFPLCSARVRCDRLERKALHQHWSEHVNNSWPMSLPFSLSLIFLLRSS